MNLKNAVLLALVGTFLLTILLLVKLANDFLAVARGLMPPIILLSSLIYAFAAISVTVFFYVFSRTRQ